MNDTKQLSFVADEETLELIRDLKRELKAPTTAAVFRKALAIAKLAVEQGRKSNGIVSVRGKSQPPDSEVAIALKA
jgi:hypothetical protein